MTKTNGGHHLTHNTNECRKYNKEGNPVTAATLKKGGNKQLAYLMATVKSLVKKGAQESHKG